MKRVLFVLALVSFVAASQVAVGSIGLNFSNNQVTDMGSGEVAGAPGYTQSNWSHTEAINSGMTDLVDSTGATTTLDVSWNAPATWRTIEDGTAGDERLMSGYLDNAAQSTGWQPITLEVTVTEIPYANYSVIVYCDGDNAGDSGEDRIAEYFINDITDTTTLAGSIFNLDATVNFDTLGYVQSTATTQAEATTSGNYIVFEGLTASDFILKANALTGDHPRAPINAIQIVEVVPEPATMALLGLGSLFGLKRRKK